MIVLNVVRLQPRPTTFDEARIAFLAGAPDACVRALKTIDTLEASILRAKALLRLYRPKDALMELMAVQPGLGRHAQLAEHRLLLASALMRTGQPETADAALTDADFYATCTNDPELLAEVAYAKAIVAWIAGDFAGAELVAHLALDPNAGHAQGKLLGLLGLVAGLRGDGDAHISRLAAAIVHFEACPERDIYLETNALSNIALPASERNTPGMREFIAGRVARLPWNAELRLHQFEITYHLAWLDALQGDHLGSFRRFRAACKLAPTDAWHALALTGRAFLAREMGEMLTTNECIEEAEELIATADWSTTTSDEGLTLLNLATLLAASDPIRAKAHLATYALSRANLDRLSVAAHTDPLLRAGKAHALGLIAQAEGDRTAAVTFLREAYDTFRGIHSMWRAAVVALDVSELTGDPGSADFARSFAETIPHSWLARRANQHDRTTVETLHG